MMKILPDDGLLTQGTRLEVFLEFAQASDGFGADDRAAGLVQRAVKARYFDKLTPADQETLRFYASRALAGHTIGQIDLADVDLWALEDDGELLPVTAQPIGAPVADGERDFSDYVMVALYPDDAARDAIAAHLGGVDGAQPPQDLHVTLAYLGKVDDAPPIDELVGAVRRAAAGWSTLSGQLGGLGQFPAGDDGVPVYAPVDVPGLSLLRDTIVDEIGEDEVNGEHGFTPHMTLGYDVEGVGPVSPTPVVFSEVHVVHGTTHVRVPLNEDGEPGEDPAGEGDWVGV